MSSHAFKNTFFEDFDSERHSGFWEYVSIISVDKTDHSDLERTRKKLDLNAKDHGNSRLKCYEKQ